MKFCPQCGAEVAPESKFCSKCGNPLENPINQGPSNTAASNPEIRPVQHSTPADTEVNDSSEVFHPEMIDFSKNKKKKKGKQNKNRSKKKLFGILIPILALLIVGGVFVLKKLMRPTIDLSPYLEIQFEGYADDGRIKDGYPCINMEKLKREIDKKGVENVSLSAQDFGEIQVLKDNKPTDGKNLQEGDMLDLQLNCDSKELFAQTGIWFNKTEKKVKVALTPLVEVDVFEDFVPQITGVSPAGHVRTDISVYGKSTSSFVAGCYKKYGTLPFDFYRNNKMVTDDVCVAVGDVIEVRLNDTGVDYLKDQGMAAEKDKEKKEITLTLAMFENGAWVTDPEKIDSEIEQLLTERMKASAESYTAKQGYTDDVQFIGMAYCSLKDGVDLDKSVPAQYFVYKIKSKYSNSDTEDEVDYIFVSHRAIYEQVENAGAEDVTENPGDVIQDFDREEDSFDCEIFRDVDSLKARFTEWNNRVDYTMDPALKNLLNSNNEKE